MVDPKDPQKSETDRGMLRSVSPYKAGFSCRCPKCGEGRLLVNGLEIREACEHCGLDFSFADTGDGAQVFVILILGAISAVLGFMLTGAGLSTAAIIGILIVVIIGGSFFMLRAFKATLVALQYHHDAHEGRMEDEAGDELNKKL